MTNGKTDIAIAGGGFAGLSLAIALRQGSGGALSVILADPAMRTASGDPRASAIAAAARRLFETIGVWQAIEPGAQPILDMVITDSKLDHATRPTFLTFDGEVAPGEPFAHMIENGPMIAALLGKARDEGVDLRALSVSQFRNEGGRVTAQLSDGTALSARLLVAADGARSVIREQAGIATVGWDYDQAGIVTTVAHERDHNGRAEEHFLPAGPFAILPLKGRRSSIVWTESRVEATRLVALPDADFLAELERRFGLHLGDLALAGPRRAYPLGLHVARSFIAERLALVGDAAHVIHPIAGQGLNMGLRDVAALAEAVIVWTESRVEATRLVALPDADFLAELERRFGLHLGDLALAGPRRAYPLGLHVARSFIAERLALVGDAAHVIHPIAGQGLNMGLRDVAALAEAVIDAARLGIDAGSASVLDRYQRWRRFDTMAMGVATDGLNRLFSNHSDMLRLVRDVGLGLVDRMPNLKDFFIREAAGLTGDVPKLLRGEAL